MAAGSVDFVLPPDPIAREIVRIGRHPYNVPDPGPQSRTPSHT